MYKTQKHEKNLAKELWQHKNKEQKKNLKLLERLTLKLQSVALTMKAH